MLRICLLLSYGTDKAKSVNGNEGFNYYKLIVKISQQMPISLWCSTWFILKDKKPTWLRIRAATIYDEKEFLAWIGGISHSFIANTV